MSIKVSEPTHNKQQFNNSQEQKTLIVALGEYMDQYQRDLNQDLSLNEFWNEFGYAGRHAHYPSNDAQYLKRRLQRIKPLMQCVLCGKWRQLRFHPKLINDPPNADTWTCEMNTDNTKQKFEKILVSSQYHKFYYIIIFKKKL